MADIIHRVGAEWYVSAAQIVQPFSFEPLFELKKCIRSWSIKQWCDYCSALLSRSVLLLWCRLNLLLQVALIFVIAKSNFRLNNSRV
jgi:hypothetical protein